MGGAQKTDKSVGLTLEFHLQPTPLNLGFLEVTVSRRGSGFDRFMRTETDMSFQCGGLLHWPFGSEVNAADLDAL